MEGLVNYLLSDDINVVNNDNFEDSINVINNDVFQENENTMILNNRFEVPMNSCDLKSRIADTLSTNSLKKSKWAVNIFNEWLINRQSSGIINGLHVFKPLADMSKGDLDSQLQYFIFETRKKNGERYPATTLRDIFQGISYHVKIVISKGWRLFDDDQFQLSRNALDAAMKEANKSNITSAGNGASTPITLQQEDKLWETGVLGDDNPTTLLRTIFYSAGKFFGLRGGKEHRELEFGKHIKLEQTEEGEALVYTNCYSKNRNGGLNQRNVKPKIVKVFMCHEKPERCFVTLYKKYASKRPKQGKSTSFYLKAKLNYSEREWFEDRVVGHNTLSNMIKTIAELGGLKGGNFVNHSLKKTTGQALKNMDDVQRRAHTGNRSEAQNIYERVTNEDFKRTSAALYGNSSNCEDEMKLSPSQTTSSVSIHVSKESCEIRGSPSKKMRIEACGETNKIVFYFD